MPSPFPGMDPWLQRLESFPDIHYSMTVHFMAALNAVLPPLYVARVAERVTGWGEDPAWPDYLVARRGPAFVPDTESDLPGAISLDGWPIAFNPSYMWFAEIIILPDRRQVAVISLLSPAEKNPAWTRGAYRQMQTELSAKDVVFVEVDMILGGLHTTMAPAAGLRERAGNPDGHISIWRPRDNGFDGSMCVIPIQLRRPLPKIPIPFSPDHPPAVVDLQSILNQAYDGGRHGMTADYSADPAVPLTADQQAWADAILREKGLRG